ncbi:MAG: PcfJ domain-containing protein [Treponema sp.]|nr:PcfJ domain-containing protein [Treponema sp.]
MSFFEKLSNFFNKKNNNQEDNNYSNFVPAEEINKVYSYEAGDEKSFLDENPFLRKYFNQFEMTGDNVEKHLFFRQFASGSFNECSYEDFEKKLVFFKTNAFTKDLFELRDKKWIPFNGNVNDLKNIPAVEVVEGCKLENIYENGNIKIFDLSKIERKSDFEILNFSAEDFENKIKSAEYMEKAAKAEKFTYDENGVKKKTFAFSIELNWTKKSFTISVYNVNEDAFEYEDFSDVNFYIKTKLFCDFNSGVKIICRQGYNDFELKKNEMPKEVFNFIKEKVLIMRNLWAGKQLSFNTCQSNEMLIYSLVTYPFEPNLYRLLSKFNLLNIKVNRKNPEIFKEFCKKYNIKNVRFIRKLYMKNPDILFFYKKLLTVGFRDFNIINKLLNNLNILYEAKDNHGFDFFVSKVIAARGELAAMHIILRNNYYFYDCVNMFMLYYDYLGEELKKSIFKNGFSKYTHDILSKFSNSIKEENIPFKYSDEELKLKDNIHGYKFLLPKGVDELRTVGDKMHNCVASYGSYVLSKESLIVYAVKDKEMRMCIEVVGNIANQYLGKNNDKLKGEDKKVFEYWAFKHNIILS